MGWYYRHLPHRVISCDLNLHNFYLFKQKPGLVLELDQWEKMLAAKPDKAEFDPEIHMVEG